MNDEYFVNCADSDELAIAYQVWDSFDNKLLYVPKMIYHLVSVLEDSAYYKVIRNYSKLKTFLRRGIVT